MPYGRLSNRYFEIMLMLRLAYHLNRTLVLIPYKGVEIDEIFDLDAVSRHFRRNHLALTWKKYQRMKNITSCLCVKSVYYVHDQERFPMCNTSAKLDACKLISSHPILGEKRVKLASIEDALTIQDYFMVISGERIWSLKSMRGFSEVLAAQNNKSPHFHLDYIRNTWVEAHHVYRWLSSRSNSSNNTTLAIHLRRGDLASNMNLTIFLESAKQISLKYSVPKAQIFIATDANSTEIEIIRHTFSLAQIECPVNVSQDCKHHVRRLVLIQAVASLATHFVGSHISTFSYVIQAMRAARKPLKYH
ncbi:unnamed protein product [Rotaria socialis]|nr:unnamed protein product [Rotaria socialis]